MISPRRAILRSIKKEKNKHQQDWKEHLDKERREGKTFAFNSKEHDETMRFYYAQLKENDDNLLIKKAEKLDILLEDIPFPNVICPYGAASKSRHHEYNTNYDVYVLDQDSRKKFRQAVKEATPLYRQERRQFYQLWISALLGIIGALTGLIAVWRN